MTEITVDCLGLKCPLPVFMARKQLGRLKPGGSLLVLADDPLAPLDLAHMAQEEGLEVARSDAVESGFEVVLHRPAAPSPSSSA